MCLPYVPDSVPTVASYTVTIVENAEQQDSFVSPHCGKIVIRTVFIYTKQIRPSVTQSSDSKVATDEKVN